MIHLHCIAFICYIEANFSCLSLFNQIEMLPTIMLFPYNKQDDILLYQGGHTSEDLVLFAMEHYTDFLDPPEIKEVGTWVTPVIKRLRFPFLRSVATQPLRFSLKARRMERLKNMKVAGPPLILLLMLWRDSVRMYLHLSSFR